MILSILSVIIGFFLEGVVFSLFLRSDVVTLEPLYALTLILMHAGSVLIFSYGIYKASIRHNIGNPKNWLIMSFAVSLIFTYLGFISFILIFFFVARKHWKEEGVYGKYDEYISYDYEPEERRVDPDKLVENVGAELEVSPLVDILGEKDVRLRRGAIGIMERLPKKDSVRLLKQSLYDNSVEIRFHAATGLSKIESELNSNITMAKREVDRNPTLPAAHLSLANSYAEYHECGILDEITAKYYMELALGEYYKVLDLTGKDDIHVLNAIGNLEVHKKSYNSALDKFQRACKIDPSDIYANVGIIQVYYQTNQITKAIQHAKKIIKKMPETKGPMREIINYWSSQ